MEKENRSRMVNLASVRQIKIIICAFFMLCISTKINAQITHPWQIRAGKLFKLALATADPLAVGKPITFRVERSPDGSSGWTVDVLGQLTPLGGQFGVIYGQVDPAQPLRWEGYASYDYAKAYTKNDFIRIICWYWTSAGKTEYTSGTILVRYFDTGKDAIKINRNPILSKDFSGSGVEIRIYPIPKGGEVPVVKIFDAFGYLVKDLSSEIKDFEVGNDSSMYSVVYWNGRNEKGNKVASGAYEVCAKMIKGEEAEIWRRKFAVSR
jgi:hypothetical protein